MSFVNHGCQCAACNMRRHREEKAHEEFTKKLEEAIKRGDFDHLKQTTDSKVD